MSRAWRQHIAALALAGAALALASPASALFANRDYYWTGNPVTIPVCWENPSAAPAERREWARDAVESTWQRYARVNFVEWDTCNPGDPGVHIRIDPFSRMPGGSTLDGVVLVGNSARLNGEDGIDAGLSNDPSIGLVLVENDATANPADDVVGNATKVCLGSNLCGAFICP